MSLVGFKAQNHPQQQAKAAVDNRGTAPEVFAPFQERFQFTLDVAASADNAKLSRYFTEEHDGLAQSWAGERVWCNPPYSNIRPWVEKAWGAVDGSDRHTCSFAEYHQGCACDVEPAQLVVMLLPANRTEQGWWQELVEPARVRGSLHVEFLRGRMRFIRPDAVIGPKGDRPPFGCCLLIWDRSRRNRIPVPPATITGDPRTDPSVRATFRTGAAS